MAFEDPITDTSYSPIKDPIGTGSDIGMMAVGIAMTLLVFTIAQNTVFPVMGDLLGSVTGGLVDTGGGDFSIGTNGGGL